MGLMDTTRPILGYVVAIAVILILSGMSFMAVTSTALVSSATTMSSILVVVALMVGIGAASKASKGV